VGALLPLAPPLSPAPPLKSVVIGIGSGAAAEAFVAQDPFILEGLIASYEIRDWADELLAYSTPSRALNSGCHSSSFGRAGSKTRSASLMLMVRSARRSTGGLSGGGPVCCRSLMVSSMVASGTALMR
jgi:hypothetical protein